MKKLLNVNLSKSYDDQIDISEEIYRIKGVRELDNLGELRELLGCIMCKYESKTMNTNRQKEEGINCN